MHPDPLEFLYSYDKMEDREIAGLVASGLAYGRVSLILKSVEKVLKVLGPNPSEFLKSADAGGLKAQLDGFRHRFTDGEEIANYLVCISMIQQKHGLAGNFLACLLEKQHTLKLWIFSSPAY